VHLNDHAVFIGDRRKTTAGYPIHIFPRNGGCKFDPETTPATLSLPPVGIGD
jgi:hypothetical protein